VTNLIEVYQKHLKLEKLLPTKMPR